MATPAIAERFIEVTSSGQLTQAIAEAKRRQWPVYVLGGGSNLLFRGDLKGLVVRVALAGISHEVQGEQVVVTAGAGESWQSLVDYCVEQGFWGLENLNLIPGTVGAAPIQNIGAYGVELESIFESLDALKIADLSIQTLGREDCEFSYRQSRFKREPGAYIVLSVTLRLSLAALPKLDYPGLQHLKDAEVALTPRRIANAVAEVRRAKLPDPSEIPNSGSFFHNPIVPAEVAQTLRSRWPGLVCYEQADGRVKLAAGWLIEQAGFKGDIRDGVGMHGQQALVMTNPGRRSGAQVLAAAEAVAAKVFHMFGVTLHVEPQILP